jgi:hypothetical protein
MTLSSPSNLVWFLFHGLPFKPALHVVYTLLTVLTHYQVLCFPGGKLCVRILRTTSLTVS